MFEQAHMHTVQFSNPSNGSVVDGNGSVVDGNGSVVVGNGSVVKVSQNNPRLLSARSMTQSAMTVECE